MKIFISHSSKDKWAARRISDDLISLGVDTFLDEKDIETGQSIDSSIRANLKNCDDFLIILSPASIKSEWVLLELGGALALEKKIIPILLYVGANEIPQAINLKLARDINTIQLYYNEVSLALSGKISQPKISAIKKVSKKEKLNSGERVLITSIRPRDVMRNESLIDWEPEMDQYLGKETFVLEEIDNVEDAYLLKNVKADTTYFVFAREWLTPIK